MSLDPFTSFDAHVHVGTWLCPEFLGRQTSLHEAARILTSCNLTGALVMPTDRGDNQGLLQDLKRFLAQSPPIALYFAAWVHLQDKANIAFVVENSEWIVALKIHPSFNRKPITDPAYLPYLELSRQKRWPVIVHCGRWQEVAGFSLALEVAHAFPDVPFILSHMGGDSPPLVTACANEVKARGLENVFLGTESIREYWLVQQVVDLLGPQRLIFGSDHNLNHPASFLAVIDALNLDPPAKALILGGNAKRLFSHRLPKT